MARKTPRRIFISSTAEDLTAHREAAEQAIIVAEHVPIRNEHWAASSEHPPYEACMKKVDEADALAVIVAHRYGWVPEDQPGEAGLSITQLECLRALEAEKEVFAFLIDGDHPWPPRLIERDPKACGKLEEFKASLSSGVIRNTFTTPDDLREKLKHAISAWEKKPLRRRRSKKTAKKPTSLAGYLTAVKNENSSIEIRGLHVSSGRAHSFPIEELYVPLKMARPAERSRSKSAVALERGANPNLEEALEHRKVVIVGDPGSGKTTFLRRIALELARARLDPAQPPRLKIEGDPLPIFIRMGELSQFRAESQERKEGPKLDESPAWLFGFLAERSRGRGWGLDEPYFRTAAQEGEALFLLDGLDEAPSRQERECLARMFEKFVADNPKCRFVVTTRPRAYEGEAVLAGFEQAEVQPFEQEAVDVFLRHWSRGLYPNDPQAAETHCAELNQALKAKPEIRLMARNPVMLTALAALYWNDKRLPDQRAELYESILTWLLRSRETRPNRAGETTTRQRLSRLALAMQTHDEGRQVQISRRWAAEAVKGDFGGDVDTAESFLAEEEVDSGVISSSGRDVRFWHLTFQEYLAAREIGGLSESEQVGTFTQDERLYQPEWREVVLLFAGVLYEQSRKRVDAFVSEILRKLGGKPSLANKARCVGLLGGIVRDLKPFNYTPADPAYEETLGAVRAIFDPVKGQKINLTTRVEAADALGLAGDWRFEDPEANWVEIQAGGLWMGAQSKDRNKPNYDEEADDDESPVHEVELRTYRIGRYPVTVAEYRRFVEDGGYERKELWTNGDFGKYEGPEEWDAQLQHPTRPVVGVSWLEAAAYCKWAGGRLPTEAEWERAARGGEGRKYPWGGEAPDPTRANFDWGEGSLGAPSPVGLFPDGASREGVLDLAGNVDEWCWDWYGEYNEEASDNPQGPAEGDGRALRGGSWSFSAGNVRASLRFRLGPSYRYSGIGFRLAREVFP